MISSYITHFLSFIGSFLLFLNIRLPSLIYRYNFLTFLYAPIFAACLQSLSSIVIYYTVFAFSLFLFYSSTNFRFARNSSFLLLIYLVLFQSLYSLIISVIYSSKFSFLDLFRYFIILIFIPACTYAHSSSSKLLSTRMRPFVFLLAIPLLLSTIYYILGVDMQTLRLDSSDASSLLEAQRLSIARKFINTFSLQFTYTNVCLFCGLSFVSVLLVYPKHLAIITFTFLANLVACILYLDKSSALALSITYLLYILLSFNSKRLFSDIVLTRYQLRSLLILFFITSSVSILAIVIFSFSSSLYLGDITLSSRGALVNRLLDVYINSNSDLLTQMLYVLFGHGLFIEKVSITDYLYILDTQGAIDSYWLEIFFSGGLFGLFCIFNFFLSPMLISLRNISSPECRHAAYLFFVFFVSSLCFRQLGNSTVMMLVLSFSVILQSYIKSPQT